MFRFTIRDVLWLTVVVALCLGWWLHYQAARRVQADILRRADKLQQKLQKAGNFVKMFHPDGKELWEVLESSWRREDSGDQSPITVPKIHYHSLEIYPPPPTNQL